MAIRESRPHAHHQKLRYSAPPLYARGHLHPSTTPATTHTGPVRRLLHDCYTTVTRLLHDCYTVVTELLHGSWLGGDDFDGAIAAYLREREGLARLDVLGPDASTELVALSRTLKERLTVSKHAEAPWPVELQELVGSVGGRSGNAGEEDEDEY